MATWTNISDTVLEPLKPIRSVDGLALRDNPIAIAEGASGAPRIQTAALDTGSVTNPKLASSAVTNVKVSNGTLGAEKFQAGTTERDWVLARTSGATQGVVGSYSFMTPTSGSVSENATTSGSSLRYSNTAVDDGSLASGTWRNMGATVGSSFATVFLRIS